MAYGDQKTYKSRSRGGGGSQEEWDTQCRQSSKRQFDKVQYSDNPSDFLRGMDDNSLVKLYQETNYITRYGQYDWSRIVRMLPDGEKEGIVELVEQAKQRIDEDAKRRQAEWDDKQANARENLKDEARLTSGYLQSELAAAIKYKEVYQRPYGDWLDDPIAAITGQGGFGEERQYSTGIRLEVNMALDCSNSMWYNGISSAAATVFKDMYLALQLAASELPDNSLIVNAWTWAKGEQGKYVNNLSVGYSGERKKSADEYGALGGMQYFHLNASYQWDGEDTWLYPLLEEIETWETYHGDPGAYRLDIVITDGVLEHPTDPKKCDEIQERRNGNLQSIMLNFLPMEDWGDYRVPNRFVQYEATVENIGALMRNILGDWIVSI